MNQREKLLLARLYACVNQLGSAGPTNPADLAGLARHSALARNVGRDLSLVVSSLGYGDLGSAAEFLRDAEAKLEADRGR